LQLCSKPARGSRAAFGKRARARRPLDEIGAVDLEHRPVGGQHLAIVDDQERLVLLRVLGRRLGLLRPPPFARASRRQLKARQGSVEIEPGEHEQRRRGAREHAGGELIVLRQLVRDEDR
jgi:hypothetical protein